MDIISHGLWAVAAGKGARIESERKWSGKWLFFWGVFPDLFAFAPIFIVRILSALFTGGKIFERPVGMIEPWTPDFHSLSDATQYLYQISHSLVIFILVALVVYAIGKRVPWVMLGWPLHILADIPTHSTSFYATPVLWPLSNIRFNGFSWGSGHFTLYNYAALLVAYLFLAVLNRALVTRRKRGGYTLEHSN